MLDMDHDEANDGEKYLLSSCMVSLHGLSLHDLYNILAAQRHFPFF